MLHVVCLHIKFVQNSHEQQLHEVHRLLHLPVPNFRMICEQSHEFPHLVHLFSKFGDFLQISGVFDLRLIFHVWSINVFCWATFRVSCFEVGRIRTPSRFL